MSKVGSKATIGLQPFSSYSGWDKSSGRSGLDTGGGMHLQPLRPPEPRDGSGTLLRALTDGEMSKWFCVAVQGWCSSCTPPGKV